MSHPEHHSRLQLWLQGLSFYHLCSAQFANVLGIPPPSAQPLPLPLNPQHELGIRVSSSILQLSVLLPVPFCHFWNKSALSD